MNIPELESNRLRMPGLNTEHSAGMFSLWSDFEVCRFSGSAVDWNNSPIDLPVRSNADSDRIIDFFLQLQRRDRGFRWAMILEKDSSFIGTVGFNSLGRCPEIAYHLHPAFWGKGYMAEACQLALSWAKENLRSEQVEAYVEPENRRSISLIQKLGFARTGAARKGADQFLIDLARFHVREQPRALYHNH